MAEYTEYKIISDNDEDRLDLFLAKIYPDNSRTYLQKLIKDGLVSVNKTIVKKPSYSVKEDDELLIRMPVPVPLEINAEDIPLNIIHEDDDILIVNKPKGMVVHPAPGHLSGTLVNAVMFHCGSTLSGINGILRPGIVHRIDMDTTGSLIICKNDYAHNYIAEQLKVHSINRIYVGIVQGKLSNLEGTVDIYLNRDKNDRKKMAVCKEFEGKRAITHYKVLEEYKDCSLVKFKLETGRTHQIRVSMSYLNHPLVGDYVYGSATNRFGIKGQVLHAKTIGFIHPTTKEYVEYNAEYSEEFNKLTERLRKEG